jgi:hypothetical protein
MRAVAPWIEDAARLAGVDAAQLRDCYRAGQAKRLGALSIPMTHAMLVALGWLNMNERVLEMRILKDMNYANSLPGNEVRIDGKVYPRFINYHTFRSQYSRPGYPDECLVDIKLGWRWDWENKRESESLSPEQEKWDVALRQCSPFGEPNRYHWLGLVKPSTWDQVWRVTILDLNPALLDKETGARVTDVLESAQGSRRRPVLAGTNGARRSENGD